MKIIIATIKSWNIKEAKNFIKLHPEHEVKLITSKQELNIEVIDEFKPRYIFFPHWSWKIPKEVYKNYECVVFHMTDLPFGRGGSPLQNLIERKIYETKISAIRVVEEIDAGPIYLKEDLCLYGSAEEIFIRAAKIIFRKMIPKIIASNIEPIPQKGKVVVFKRRKKEQGDVSKVKDIMTLYDYIRMLDAEGYPPAYIETDYFIFEFHRASLKTNKIIADVVIKPKEGIDNEQAFDNSSTS